MDLSLQGHTQRQISAMKNRPLSTINRIIQAYRNERKITDAPRKPRPQVTTENEDMAIVAAAVDNPSATVDEIKQSTGLTRVSNTTVKRRLYAAGLKSRTAVQKPIVSGVNKQKRLDFATEHLQWTEEHWAKVVFTDESSFTTRWDQRQRVWRPQNCRYMPEYMQRVAASGRSAVSVWGAVTAQGLGPLVRIEGRFTADAYCGLLDDVLLPYLVGGPFPENDFILQHDNSPIHKSKKVAAYLERRDVAVLEWPPQSPDLNIIENVWGNMKLALAHRQLRAVSADVLWAIVQEEWERIRADTNICRSLYSSLPNRINAVIGAGGEPTRY